jgi:hypothetical protein
MKKLFIGLILAVFTAGIAAQEADKKSIGGKEHEANIYGVTIGMDVPTALEAVFVNGNRQPGQEKPDAKKAEGRDKKDVRVLYKNLPMGELQIVFADGKYVKEMILVYAKPLLLDDLRLPFTSSLGNSTSLITTSTVGGRDPNVERGNLSTNTNVLDGTKEIDGYNASNTGNIDRRRGEALDGTRYDDRYTIAFADNQKLQRLWFRQERTPQDYNIQIQFASEKVTKAGANQVVKIIQKVIFLLPEDEKEFRKSVNLPN